MMSENGNKVGLEETAIDEVDGIVAESDSVENAEPEVEAAPRKKKHFGRWLFLLFIFIGLPAAWFSMPTEMRQQTQDVLVKFMPQSQTGSHPVQSPAESVSTHEIAAPASKPEPASQVPAEITDADSNPDAHSNDTVAIEDTAPTKPESTAIENASNAAIPATENMQAILNRFKSELTNAQLEARTLRATMQAERKQTLSALLRVLAKPQTKLAQQAEIWTAIASLPGLADEQKDSATSMAELADKNLKLMQQWQNALLRLANQISDTKQADIIPKSENPYFAWLFGTFHLRPVASQSDAQAAQLRGRLLDMARAISLEDWPEQSEWRTLIGDARQQFGDDVDLPDPEVLPHALLEIALPHKAAAKWLEDL